MVLARDEGILFQNGDDLLPELRKCSTQYLKCKVERYILLIGCPSLMAMSLVGNSITLSVMCRPKLRHTAAAVFISTLAVMDCVANVTGLSRHFIIKNYKVDVRELSPFSCSIHRFILFVALDSSSWLLAVIAIERFLAVCRPAKHKLLGSARIAFKVTTLIIFVQIAFNMHVFWSRGKNWEQPEPSNVTITWANTNCGYTSQYARYFWNVHQGWMSMVWYGLLPFSVMLILNTLIVRRLYQLKKSSLQRAASNLSASGITKKANSMTVMLLSVTFYFVVVTTPVFIFTMIQSLLFYTEEINDEQLSELELIDAIVTLLLYLNHSINFFLYCLSGRRFRRELKEMCGCLTNRAPVGRSPRKQENDQSEAQPNYTALTAVKPNLYACDAEGTALSNLSGL